MINGVGVVIFNDVNVMTTDDIVTSCQRDGTRPKLLFQSPGTCMGSSTVAFSCTGTPPITLFFGPEKNYCVIGKTVLKED